MVDDVRSLLVLVGRLVGNVEGIRVAMVDDCIQK